MIKKIVLGVLLVGLIGILVAGGIIRTLDKTGNVAEARGQGEGNGHGSVDREDCEDGQAVTQGQGQGGQGQGQGGQGNGQGGQGQGSGGTERQYPNYEEAPEEWATVEGTVVESPVDGGELVVQTSDGQEITVGTGPGYMEAEGFVLQAGEAVRVQGYWEDGELKAAAVTRLRDGQTITLRDQVGRPAWSGRGKRAAEESGAAPLGEQSPGAGTGQADVQEWLTAAGTVTSVDSLALVVQTPDGEIVIEGRPWRFAQELGFQAATGDTVTLLGFDENGEFEVGRLDNETTGESFAIRGETGRPLWAGGGRRGG